MVKELRLLVLAAALLGIAACGVTMPSPTASPVVVPLPTGALARAATALLPAATATPTATTAATPSPTATWVLRAPLPTEAPALTATPRVQATLAPEPVRRAVSGRLVVQTSSGGPIVAVNADGTEAVTLASGLDPAWSPDGKRIAFTRWSEPQGICVMNADGSDLRMVYQINGAKNPVWSPDGTKIAFNAVYKQEKRQPRWPPGAPATVTDYWRVSVIDLTSGNKTDVMLDGDQQAFSPSWGPDGRFVYKGVRGLFVTTETGWPSALTDNPLQASPVWSPDGKKVAFMVDRHDHWDIAVVNNDGGGPIYLTSTPFVMFAKPVSNAAPAWSPDGSHIAFITDRERDWRIYVMNADGSDQHRLLDLAVTYEFAAERVLSWTR
jgi:dipeptidyl aminopeptidase/acylaminoacyl peptidase